MPAALAELLRARIAGKGPMPFRDFMEAALYHPEHGYYGSGRAKLGRSGDFYTNVSVGLLFGALLARQFEEMWQRLGQPERFTIVEQGADRGHFARDVMEHVQRVAPAFLEALQYVVVEPFARAAAVQRATLESWAGKTRWVSSLETLEPFTGVHFSNELLDAFPVHAVVWTGSEWQERLVDHHDGRFVFTAGPLSEQELGAQLARVPAPVSAGYEAEVNLASLDWITQLARKLVRGFVLAVDYGFSRAELYRPERTCGTLSGYSEHRREPDVLSRPGEIDLTAHVDFTSLAEHARFAGLGLHGFTDQHHFMVGVSQLHFDDNTPLTRERERELRAFKTLMHPNLMGQSFKVICFEKGGAASTPLAGFTYARDSRGALGIEG